MKDISYYSDPAARRDAVIHLRYSAAKAPLCRASTGFEDRLTTEPADADCEKCLSIARAIEEETNARPCPVCQGQDPYCPECS